MASELNPSRPRVPAIPRSPILITGATGFIGGHLTERLVAGGASVRILARNPERAEALGRAGAEVRIGDLTRPETIRECCDGCSIVFHCAAWLGTPYTQDAAWKNNVAGTEALIAEALAAGVRRFVHLSSIAVYGPARHGVITEDSPLWRGVELYGDTKIAGEAVVRAAIARGLPAVITRPGMVYGPRSRGWTIRMVQWIKAGRPATVAGGHGLARPIFIQNLLDALLLCADRPVIGEAFTLVDANIRWREYLGHYARMIGKPVRSVPYFAAWLIALGDEVRAAVTARPPRIRRTALGYAVSHATFSTQKAQDLLGWTPRYSLEAAMAITARWLKAQGYLRE